jgi:tRNA (guanosine-2'-O-)-methyltransferase
MTVYAIFARMSPEREQKLLAVINKRQPDLTIILENVFDPHNISAVMRTCDAVGIHEIYVLNTRIPPHDRYGTRSSSSAYKWILVRPYDNLDKCLEDVRLKYDRIFTTHLNKDSVSLYDMDLTQRTALVFGNEHFGCSQEIIAKADGNFLVPQAGIIRSLNISVACAVSLYEAYRQKNAAGHYNAPKLEEYQVKELYREWKMYNYFRN